MNREILVHIAAPSSLRDDVRYRAQVDALLGFQPVARERIPLTSSPALALPESEAVCAATPDAPIQPVASGDTHHDSWNNTPVSVIPDSQPAPLTGDSNPSPNTGPNSPPNPAAGRKISPAPSTEYDGASKRRRLTSPHNDKATADTTLVTTSAERQAQEAPQHATRTDTSAPAPAPAPSPATKPATSEATDITPVTLRTLHLPLEIKPPLPPISTTAFTTHITPTLAMLASRLKSPRTYTPLTQTRDLDVLERGHWQVRLSLVEDVDQSPSETERTSAAKSNTWDMVFFTRFWNFLTEFITEQRAGWGVWCILEEDVGLQADTRAGAGAASASHGKGDTGHKVGEISPEKDAILRVYAWGEVAVHVYLLLFLASERRIRKMGAQWRDGSDEVVIQMPAHPSSASSLGS